MEKCPRDFGQIASCMCCPNPLLPTVLDRCVYVYCVTDDATFVKYHAQATLGVLYAQPPLTQDANVATDGAMMLGIVEQIPEAKKLEEDTSPNRPASPRVDVSQNGIAVAMSVKAASADGVAAEALLAPPTVPTVAIDQQKRGEAQDVPNVTEVPEVRVQATRGCHRACSDSVRALETGSRDVLAFAGFLPTAPCRALSHEPVSARTCVNIRILPYLPYL